MKRIGILTHYYQSKNIGGLLQAYALCAFLRKHETAAEQIAFRFRPYSPQAHETYRRLFPQRKTLKKFVRYLPYRLKQIFLRWRNRQIAPQVAAQNSIFAKFEQFIPHSTGVYTEQTIRQANACYDVFITGSDQVFASYLLPFSAYYGEFAAPDKKVLAYAASSDMKQFPPQAKTFFAQKIMRIDALSVREKTLKAYIERISDKKVTLVLDPTFLLTPEEWLQIANPAAVPPKPYILCYFLGEKSRWQRQKARAFADTYGYELVHLPYIMGAIRPADELLGGRGLYTVGPREFIALVQQAQCIFTDSFHGMAFALNFGKNFYVFDRDDASGAGSMNARITDTLDMLGLSQRRITDPNAVLDNTPLDFSSPQRLLQEQKQLSQKWLMSAL